MSNLLTAVDLEAAADLLETHGHMKHDLTDGVRHCAIGALINVTMGSSSLTYWVPEGAASNPRIGNAIDAVVQHLDLDIDPDDHCPCCQVGWNDLVDWNNAQERTGAEVVNAFRLAAKDIRNTAEPE